MFPKFLEETYKVANQKFFLDSPSLSVVIDDENQLFVDNLIDLKNYFLIQKNQYIDFSLNQEYYTYLENLNQEKIEKIKLKCSNPEKVNLMPYLIKFLRFSDVVNKTSPKTRTKKSTIDSRLKKLKIVDSEKINQTNQLFLKINKKKVINLENVAKEIVMLYIQNKTLENSENILFDPILIPTLYDLNFFNNLYQNENDIGLRSPETTGLKKKSNNLPKVITLTSNLETNGQTPSFINLKQSAIIDQECGKRSLNQKMDFSITSLMSSAKLRVNELRNSCENLSGQSLANNEEIVNSSENKLNLKIVYTDSSNGVLHPSPISSSNQLFQKINNFYLYYHTVKRNVNPTNHRRQYSKSIQYFF